MQVVQVDERTSSWEDSRPVFRVYLHGTTDEASNEDVRVAWTDTYDITGADALQVIDWAQRQGRGTLRWAIALVGQDDAADIDHRHGLTWLIGMDGFDAPSDAAEQATLDRMDKRVHEKVVIPKADRAPHGINDVYI